MGSPHNDESIRRLTPLLCSDFVQQVTSHKKMSVFATPGRHTFLVPVNRGFEVINLSHPAVRTQRAPVHAFNHALVRSMTAAASIKRPAARSLMLRMLTKECAGSFYQCQEWDRVSLKKSLFCFRPPTVGGTNRPCRVTRSTPR